MVVVEVVMVMTAVVVVLVMELSLAGQSVMSLQIDVICDPENLTGRKKSREGQYALVKVLRKIVSDPPVNPNNYYTGIIIAKHYN